MIFASNNKGKLTELKKIFTEYNIKTLQDAGIEIDVEEDQDTFEGNASKKAVEIFNLTGEAAIADDSGLCIDAFNGWPGVLTHRFLGDNKTDRERNVAIIERMKNLPPDKRTASARSVLVCYDGKQTKTGEGTLSGVITTAPRGGNGFGYDEIFELPNGKTLAEISIEEKNRISPRFLAAVALKQKLEK